MSVRPPPTIWGPSRPGQQWPAGASGSLCLSEPQPCLVGRTSTPRLSNKGWCPKGPLQGPHPSTCPTASGEGEMQTGAGPAPEQTGCGWAVAGGPQGACGSPVPAWSPTRKPQSGAQGGGSRDQATCRGQRQTSTAQPTFSLCSPGLPTHLLRKDAVERLHLLSCRGRLWLVVPVALVW